MREEWGAGFSKSQPAEQSEAMIGKLPQNHSVAVAQNVREASDGDCALKGQFALIDKFPIPLESVRARLRAHLREQTRCLADAEVLINQMHASPGRPMGVIISLGAALITQPKFSGWATGLMRVLKSHPVKVLSDWEEPQHLVVAFRARVRGYVSKSLDPRIAVQAAIRLALSGSSFLPAASRWSSRTAEPSISGRPRVGTRYLFQYTV